MPVKAEVMADLGLFLTRVTGKVDDEIKLLKQNNFNAVRPGHYPLSPRWYELADEYGLWNS